MDGEIIVLPERIKPKRKYNRQPNFLTTNKKDELSVIERKILYLVMNQLDDNDMSRFKYTILANQIDTNIPRIAKALHKILNQSIFITNNEKGVQEIKPFIDYKYHYGTGLITMVLNPVHLSVFYDRKHGFTSFQLDNAMKLRSKYSQKLYEILSRWRDKKSLLIDVADLQRDLCAEDKEYGNFKRRCLNQAMREINEKTEITFSYTEVKQGKSVVSLILCKIEKDKESNRELQTEINKELDVAETLTPGDVKFHLANMYRAYDFAPWQREKLETDRALFKRFVKLNILIREDKIKIQTTPTRYIAHCLFKDKRKAA